MIIETADFGEASKRAREMPVAYVSMVTQLGKWIVADEPIFNPNQKIIVYRDGHPDEFICGLDGRHVKL